MPKTKKIEESSDSDSGPEDRNPPPSKKSKDGESKDDSLKTDSKGESYWELPRNRRVSMSTFKGKQYLNIREYYQNKSSGEWCPGKSGITLTKVEWEELMALKPKINFH